MLNNIKLSKVSLNGTTHVKVESNIFDLSVFEIKDGKVNLTKVCQYFNKDIRKWTSNKSTKEFLASFADENPMYQNGGIAILKGGNGEQGTFGVREIAIELARWISPKFSVWCNKQLDTLFQTGKVELKPKLPVNSLEAAEMLANQVIMLVAKVKQGQAELKEKEATVKAQQEVITSQNDTHVSLINLKAREFKTVHSAVKADIGKEINHYVRELYLKQAGGDYRKAHQIARKEFNWDTGEEYLGAKLTSLETKKVYLKWLRGQILANKNQLQLA